MSSNAQHRPPSGTGGGLQADYDIRAPEGGLREAIATFETGQRNWLDVEVSRTRGHRVSVRIYPDRGATAWDSTRPEVFHFRSGMCVKLVDGIETGNVYKCSGRVNVQVTHAPLETGKLGILFPNLEETL